MKKTTFLTGALILGLMTSVGTNVLADEMPNTAPKLAMEGPDEMKGDLPKPDRMIATTNTPTPEQMEAVTNSPGLDKERALKLKEETNEE